MHRRDARCARGLDRLNQWTVQVTFRCGPKSLVCGSVPESVHSSCSLLNFGDRRPRVCLSQACTHLFVCNCWVQPNRCTGSCIHLATAWTVQSIAELCQERCNVEKYQLPIGPGLKPQPGSCTLTRLLSVSNVRWSTRRSCLDQNSPIKLWTRILRWRFWTHWIGLSTSSPSFGTPASGPIRSWFMHA